MTLLRWWLTLRMFSGCLLLLVPLVGFGVGIWSLFAGSTAVGLVCVVVGLGAALLIGRMTKWWERYGAAVKAHERGRFDEAARLLEGLRWRSHGLHRLDPRRALLAYALGEVYRAQARYQESAARHREALALREELYGPERGQTVQSLIGLANVDLELCQFDEARALYERSLDTLLRQRGPNHPYVGVCLNNLGKLHGDQRDYARAEEYYRRALEILEGRRRPHAATLALLLSNVASAVWRQDRGEESERLCRRALALCEQSLPPDHRTVGLPLNNLAQSLRLQKRYAEAEDYARRALDLWERAYGPEHPATATAVDTLSMVYRDLGKLDLALALSRRALAAREAGLEPNSPDLLENRSACAELLRRLGRDAEAEAVLRPRGPAPAEPTAVRETPPPMPPASGIQSAEP
jgi:tetratricopeptide (TPR) repeat protein